MNSKIEISSSTILLKDGKVFAVTTPLGLGGDIDFTLAEAIDHAKTIQKAVNKHAGLVEVGNAAIAVVEARNKWLHSRSLPFKSLETMLEKPMAELAALIERHANPIEETGGAIVNTTYEATVTCRVCQCAVPAATAILNVPIGGVDSQYRGDVCPSCWQKFKRQVFEFTKDGVTHRWSIPKAQQIIAEGKLEPVAVITRAVAFDAMCKNDTASELELEHVMSADLNKPLIVVLWHQPGGPGSHIIIDGWHRIAKFVDHSDRREPLLAYVLNEEQSKRIKIC